MNKDLTVGKPRSVLWKFCIPLFASVLFQQLYNIADSFVAGKFISNEALAAVGNSYEITLIFIAVASGCNVGCSVIVSQLFGGKQYGKLKTAVYTTLISCGVLCILLMTAGLLLCSTLLTWIRTPADIFADSGIYLRIYLLGIPFVFFYNISTGIFSALGDSKTPFFFLACSSTANILMDILFVAGFHMGVAGVAWATFLCQGISCVLALLFVFRRFRQIEAKEAFALFSWSILRRIAAIAVPSMIQQSFISVGNIVLQGIINGFGSGVIAGYSAAIKLNNMVITSLCTLANGVSNFTAQNIGAERFARVRQGFRDGLIMIWCLSLPLTALFLLAGKPLISIFLESPTGLAMDSARHFLVIVVPFYCIVSVKLISDAILRGAGLMKQFMVGTFADLILRVGLAYLLSHTVLGYIGIWAAWPVGWTISTGSSIFFYCRHIGSISGRSADSAAD